MQCWRIGMIAVLGVSMAVQGLAQAAKHAPARYFVAMNGNDAWSGKLPDPNTEKTDGPFRTLAKAAATVKPGDTCFMREGVYRETLTLRTSGAPETPITFQNYRDETAVLSGADPVTGWRLEDGAIYSAVMDWGLDDQNQIFADSEMLTEARWPNNTGTLLQPVRATVESGTPETITDPNLPGGDDFWKGALFCCVGGSEWNGWTSPVTAYDAKTKTFHYEPKPKHNRWYLPKKGNPYILMGIRGALDSEGEWWFDHDAKRLHLWAPGGKDPNALQITAKRRVYVIDLSGCSNVRIVGLHFRAGGILTDDKSSDILLEGLSGRYLGHSYKKDISSSGSVVVRGKRIEVNSCEFAIGSGSLLHVRGEDHRIINCYVHEGDYAGMWGALVVLGGRRLVVSHNTFCEAGRDIIGTSRLTESIVEYNDLSYPGRLTCDLGMTYGHTTDFQNTVFRYNHVHDNVAKHSGAGIYFDHLGINVIVHHNVIWNVPNTPIQFNNPGYFELAFNNTTWHAGYKSKRIGTFDHSKRNDLFGARFYNNIVNVPFRLPPHVFLAGNIVSEDPGFVDPSQLRLDLKPGVSMPEDCVAIAGVTDGSTPYAGAYAPGKPLWTVGHDFTHPPKVGPWQAPDIAYMNGIRNSCFEYGIENWTPTGAGSAKTIYGNGWGNGYGRGETEPTGTCKGVLCLGGGRDGVEQTIPGLFPETAYRLSGWVKVSDEKESVRLGVKDFGGPEPQAFVDSNSTIWTRLIIEFKTGPAATSAVVFVEKTSDGPGHAFADNLGLPKRPKGGEWERPAPPPPLKPPRVSKTFPPFTAKRVSQPPVMDGRLSPGEWPAAATMLNQSPGGKTLGTPPCSLKACHDGPNLYVAVTVPVKDVGKLGYGRKWTEHDGAEVCLAAATGDRLGTIFVLHGFVDGTCESVTEAGAPAPLAKALGQVMCYAASVDDGQWTGEWAIPLAAVGVSPAPGVRVVFNAGVRRTESNEWVTWIATHSQTWRLENAGFLILE